MAESTPEEIAQRLTEAQRYALRLFTSMDHVEWNFYPASFKRLAALGLVRKDHEGWARCEPLGSAVNEALRRSPERKAR